jgi:hypothetical protein
VLRAVGLTAGAIGVVAPIVAELRLARAVRPLTGRWQQLPVEPRGSAGLGISVRPRQLEAMGLDEREALRALLAYPFQLVRLGAYWNRIEPAPGRFRPDELDRQIDIAEQAGKQIIVCVGAVKTFGYPEFFVPEHHLPVPLPEGTLIDPAGHRRLHTAALTFLTRLVQRYRDRRSIIAWQVEHDAVDPLGMEHSWRLSADFVRGEVDAVRAADPTRPVMMNGFLPTSTPVRLQQWWRTRDQGDSLAVAQRLADVVGIDFYPRHAVAGLGARTLYLEGSTSPPQQRRRRELFTWAAAPGRELMVSEGQAEPWETTTNPPHPGKGAMRSCGPENVISNYNQCLRWSRESPSQLSAYLFWGAEYWLRRQRDGDPSYLRAFSRVLDNAGP